MRFISYLIRIRYNNRCILYWVDNTITHPQSNSSYFYKIFCCATLIFPPSHLKCHQHNHALRADMKTLTELRVRNYILCLARNLYNRYQAAQLCQFRYPSNFDFGRSILTPYPLISSLRSRLPSQRHVGPNLPINVAMPWASAIKITARIYSQIQNHCSCNLGLSIFRKEQSHQGK